MPSAPPPSYTQVFGGGLVSPSDQSYLDYVLTGPVLLQWPLETQPNTNLAAQIIDIDVTSTGAFSLTLPPANQVSVGQFLIFSNKSSFVQTVFANDGSTVVASISAGAIYFVYLTNNSTAIGVWSAFQYGAQVSAPNAAALAGAGLTAIGAQLAQNMVILAINTNFVVGVNNRDQFINWTGASGNITLPLASVAGNGFYIQTRNSGSSVYTVFTAGSDTINGSASQTFNPGDSAFVVTDGVSWYTLGLGPTLAAGFNFIVINVPAVISGTIVTLSGTQLNQIAYKFTGALTANTLVDLPAIKQEYWVDNETTGAFTLTFQVPTVVGGPTPAGAIIAIGQNTRAILYTDGTNVVNASTAGIAIPLSISQGGTGATSAGAALVALGGTTDGVAVFTAVNNAAAQAAIAAPSVADSVVFAMVF